MGSGASPPQPLLARCWHRGTTGFRFLSLPRPLSTAAAPTALPRSRSKPVRHPNPALCHSGGMAQHRGTAQHPAWGWSWGLEHLPRHGWKGRAKQALVPAPSLNHASTASSWQGMLRMQQAEPQQWSRAAFKSILCVLPWCPMGSQVPSRSRALQSPHHSKHNATAQGSAQPGPHQLTPETHPEIT